MLSRFIDRLMDLIRQSFELERCIGRKEEGNYE